MLDRYCRQCGAAAAVTRRLLHRSCPALAAATTSLAPKKVEVFIDERKILVDPGVTILQVTSFFMPSKQFISGIGINYLLTRVYVKSIIRIGKHSRIIPFV